MGKWGVYEDEDGDRHVKPIADLNGHGDKTCWCKPTEEDGVWVHHSVDQREDNE